MSRCPLAVVPVRASFRILVLAALAVPAACGHSAESRGGASASAVQSVGDSAAPPAPPALTHEQEVERFLRNLAPASRLEGTAPSVAALVATFAEAVERRDEAALRRLALTRAEFGHLVYPTSPFTRPPYRQDPALVWMRVEVPGEVGLRRVLTRYGGTRIDVRGHACDPRPEVEGPNRLWKRCAITFVDAAGVEHTKRLFGVVIERAGRFKLVSYENQL